MDWEHASGSQQADADPTSAAEFSMACSQHPAATNMVVNLMLLLGHTAKLYELEKADFLRQLKASKAIGAQEGTGK